MEKNSCSRAKTLTLKEISNLLAISVKKISNKNTSAEMAKLYYLALIELISEELKRNGKFIIPNIGTLETSVYGGFRRNTFNVNTQQYNLEKVPERIIIKFTPADFIKAYLNNREIPLSTKRRNQKLKAQKLKEISKKELVEKEKKNERMKRKERAYKKMIQPIMVEIEE